MKTTLHDFVTAVFCSLLTIAYTASPVCAEPVEVLEAHEEYVYMIVFSEDDRRMVTASGDDTAIVWDMQSRKPLLRLLHEAAVYAAVITPEGKTIATGSSDGLVTLWNATEGTKFKQVQKHRDAVYCVAISPDGKLLATGGGSTDGGDTTCRLWKMPELELVAEFPGHKRQVYGLAFSPDGKLLATTSSDKTVRLWDLATGNYQELLGHTSDVYRCDFSSDGKLLATASEDKSIRVWSVETGETLHTLFGNKRDPFYATVFSPDGNLLAGVASDRRLHLWNTTDWQLRSDDRYSDAALYTVEFTHDQHHVAVAGEDGKVYLIDTPGSE